MGNKMSSEDGKLSIFSLAYSDFGDCITFFALF